MVHAQRLQVEEKKRGVAPGTPVAIQQHQDIIAANYPARAAGVKKHMRPAEVPSCMRRLNSIGCLLHAADNVYCTNIIDVHLQNNGCAFANPDETPRTFNFAGPADPARSQRHDSAGAHGGRAACELRPVPRCVASDDQAAGQVMLPRYRAQCEQLATCDSVCSLNCAYCTTAQGLAYRHSLL